VGDIAAAVAVGVALGVPLDVITAGVEALNGVPGQLESVDEGQPFAVIVDEARTPAELERTLKAVRDCGAQHIITVMGCQGDGCAFALHAAPLCSLARLYVLVRLCLTRMQNANSDKDMRPVMGRTAHQLSDVLIVRAPPFPASNRPARVMALRMLADTRTRSFGCRRLSKQVTTDNPNFEDEFNILSDVVAGFDQEVYRSEEARVARSWRVLRA
jgi:UDP-N-acetylmuramoylalanine-D-glutamate ligase